MALRSARTVQRPAALLYGPGHTVVHGNAPFRALFGSECLGLPAAEALIDLPRAAFELMDLVYRDGRPLARAIALRGATWRLTIGERRDIGTGEVYGIAIRLAPSKRDRAGELRGAAPALDGAIDAGGRRGASVARAAEFPQRRSCTPVDARGPQAPYPSGMLPGSMPVEIGMPDCVQSLYEPG